MSSCHFGHRQVSPRAANKRMKTLIANIIRLSLVGVSDTSYHNPLCFILKAGIPAPESVSTCQCTCCCSGHRAVVHCLMRRRDLTHKSKPIVNTLQIYNCMDLSFLKCETFMLLDVYHSSSLFIFPTVEPLMTATDTKYIYLSTVQNFDSSTVIFHPI